MPPEFFANLPRDAVTLQTKGHIIQHRPVVETGVVLEYHAAICTRAGHGLAQYRNGTCRRRMLRLKSGDQFQDRAFSATTRTKYANEFAVTWRVLYNERDILDRREFICLTDIVRFADSNKLNDCWRELPGLRLCRLISLRLSRLLGRCFGLIFVRHYRSDPVRGFLAAIR